MLNVMEARRIVNRVFEEEALAVAGMAAIRELGDEQVWQLMRHMDLIRKRALGWIDDLAPDGIEGEPHPAITEFLGKVKETARA